MSAWEGGEIGKMYSLQKYLSRFIVTVWRQKTLLWQNEFLNCIGSIWAAKHLQLDMNMCSLKGKQFCQKGGAKAMFLILFLVSNKLFPFIWGINKWSDCICIGLGWLQIKSLNRLHWLYQWFFFQNYCYLEHIDKLMPVSHNKWCRPSIGCASEGRKTCSHKYSMLCKIISDLPFLVHLVIVQLLAR